MKDKDFTKDVVYKIWVEYYFFNNTLNKQENHYLSYQNGANYNDGSWKDYVFNTLDEALSKVSELTDYPYCLRNGEYSSPFYSVRAVKSDGRYRTVKK